MLRVLRWSINGELPNDDKYFRWALPLAVLAILGLVIVALAIGFAIYKQPETGSPSIIIVMFTMMCGGILFMTCEMGASSLARDLEEVCKQLEMNRWSYKMLGPGLRPDQASGKLSRLVKDWVSANIAHSRDPLAEETRQASQKALSAHRIFRKTGLVEKKNLHQLILEA